MLFGLLPWESIALAWTAVALVGVIAVFGPPLQWPAWMMGISCETARAEDPLSDEIVNFPTALLQCGLSGVVGSLWTSHDRASAMMMEAFYREWQGRQAPPAEALRTAQKWTREHRFASPLFWANFVYVGP